jgi:hypothetical protein
MTEWDLDEGDAAEWWFWSCNRKRKPSPSRFRPRRLLTRGTESYGADM